MITAFCKLPVPLLLAVSFAASCAPSGAAAAEDCKEKIAKIEEERKEYAERAVAELKKLPRDASGEPHLKDQAAFADFATQMDGFENQIRVERLRCSGAAEETNTGLSPKVDMSSYDAQD